MSWPPPGEPPTPEAPGPPTTDYTAWGPRATLLLGLSWRILKEREQEGGKNLKARMKPKRPARPFGAPGVAQDGLPDEPCCATGGPEAAALTHDGVLGLEQGSPLAQPHGSAHLPRVVFRHVYDLEVLGNKHALPHAASVSRRIASAAGRGPVRSSNPGPCSEGMVTTEQRPSSRR